MIHKNPLSSGLEKHRETGCICDKITYDDMGVINALK
jgi:hypothetical protein